MVRRLLPHDEWHKLSAIVKACFGDSYTTPTPDVAPLCAVEEDDDGNILGFLFLQLVPHLEPFGSLGGVSFGELKKCIDGALLTIPNMVYYSYTDNPAIVARAVSRGWTVKGTLLEGTKESR